MGYMLRRGLVGVLWAAVLCWCHACTEKELDPNDAKKSFGIAKEPYDDEHWEDAIRRLGEFKSRFPYSQFTAEAELLIANAHFQLGQYGEAAASYEQFVKLHPKHPKVDYAMFRVGESYWEDSPEVVSREQEYTAKAVDQWKSLIDKMPDSPYASKAKELVGKGRRRLAESHEFVARFYCKQEIYHACAYRYMKLLDEYAEFKDITENALEEAAFALDKVADAKQADPESDKNLFFKKMSVQDIRTKATRFREIHRGDKKEG